MHVIAFRGKLRCFGYNFFFIIPVKRVDELGSMVAFHAEMGPGKSNLTQHHPILFETPKVNFGNAYDPKFGVFTCPKYGLYFFTFTIMAQIGKEMDSHLVVNGSPIAYGTAGSPPTLYGTGSQSVIVVLNPGDRVWLERHSGDHALYGGGWSTLTGFLIKET